MKNAIRRIGRALAVTTAFALVALAPSESPLDGIKQKACRSVGCPDETDLHCISTTITVETPFVSGEVSVTCYEPARPQ